MSNGINNGVTIHYGKPVPFFNSIVIIGTKKRITKQMENIFETLNINNQTLNTSHYKSVIDSLSISELSGNEFLISLPTNDESKFLQISFLILPSIASRHNCRTRSEVIFESRSHLLNFKNSFLQQTTNQIVVLIKERNNEIEEERDQLSIVGSIARSFPLFSRKSNNNNNNGNTLSVNCSFFHSKRKFEYTKEEKMEELNRRYLIITENIRITNLIVDKPCNEFQCSDYLLFIRDQILNLQTNFPQLAPFISYQFIVGSDLRDQGFGGIWGVGKAASQPPALVILKFTPQNAKKNIVWVGKGIVYDTGGLSIKSDMSTMKIDMGGSAAIFSAWKSAVQLNFSENLFALLCLAENSVGPLATRPDDIHTLYSGKTVEINNTDAEGRLVLADGVAYGTKEFAPVDVLVDMCTLTGAQGIATGKRHAAIVCNDENLERAAIAAGLHSGDLVHPLLYCPEFFNAEFSSKVADMKNSVASRGNASSSCAAQFIANHFNPNFKGKWLHVDMASPAFRNERATGYGVLLLLQLFVLEQLPF